MFAHASAIEHTGITIAAAVCTIAYLSAWSSLPEPNRIRALAFCVGVGVVYVALNPATEAMASRTFSGHMVQHLLLYAVAPGLVLFGRPLRLASRFMPRPFRIAHRRLGRVSRFAPLIAATSTIVVLYSLHLTSLYDTALSNNFVHALTHLALFGSGVAIWIAATGSGVSGGAYRVGLALFMSVPIAILGVVLTSSTKPLSDHYVGLLGLEAALRDQHAGGALMWIGAMLAGAILTISAVWRWASAEQAIADRVEEIQAVGR